MPRSPGLSGTGDCDCFAESESLASTTQSVSTVTNNDIIENGFRASRKPLHSLPVSRCKRQLVDMAPLTSSLREDRTSIWSTNSLDNSTFRSGPVQYGNTVDALNLDRFELVKSQGSVLYGSDSLGGTLNAITVASGYRDKAPGFFQSGFVFYRYDTNSESQVGRIQQSLGSGGRWGLTLGTNLKEFGDVRSDYYGRMRGTGYPEQNYDLKFEMALSRNHYLTLAHQFLNQDDINRWHSTLENPGGWEGLAPGGFTSRVYDQERSLSYFRLEGDDLDGPIQRYRATYPPRNHKIPNSRTAIQPPHKRASPISIPRPTGSPSRPNPT